MVTFKQHLEQMAQLHELFENGRTSDQIVERAKELGLETHPDDARELDLNELIYKAVVLNEEIDFAEVYYFCKKYKFNPMAFEYYRDQFYHDYVKYIKGDK